MKDRKGLGRGFASLIPDAQSEKELREQIVYVGIENLRPNKKQPRKNFDKESLKELSNSIKEKGIIQPLLVKKVENGYNLIAGERRFEAAKMSGLSEVPVIVRSTNEFEDLELALIENIQRENLNPIEEAAGYKMLCDEFDLSHDEIAKKVGKERSTITNFLRLLKLPEKVQEALLEGKISMGHARTILSLEDEEAKINFLNQILNANLSVRKTESLAKGIKKTGKSFKLDSKLENPFLRSIIEELQQVFGTRVKILQKKDSKGKLIIDFYSTQDLNRILGIIRK